MKNLTSAGTASTSSSLSKPVDLYDGQFVLHDEVSGVALAGAPYRLEDAAGKVLASGFTDAQGRTARLTTGTAKGLKLHWGMSDT